MAGLFIRQESGDLLPIAADVEQLRLAHPSDMRLLCIECVAAATGCEISARDLRWCRNYPQPWYQVARSRRAKGQTSGVHSEAPPNYALMSAPQEVIKMDSDQPAAPEEARPPARVKREIVDASGAPADQDAGGLQQDAYLYYYTEPVPSRTPVIEDVAMREATLVAETTRAMSSIPENMLEATMSTRTVGGRVEAIEQSLQNMQLGQAGHFPLATSRNASTNLLRDRPAMATDAVPPEAGLPPLPSEALSAPTKPPPQVDDLVADQ